jgi:hypothetical protein
MPGAAKALDSTSNPSSALSAIISTTAIHCRAVIGDWQITSRGSFSIVSLPPAPG